MAASLGLGLILQQEKLEDSEKKQLKRGLKCGILGAFPSLSPGKQEVNHQMSLSGIQGTKAAAGEDFPGKFWGL